MGQVLSEGEVDALLKGVGEGEVQTETDQVDEVTGVTAYDLTSQEKLLLAGFPLWISSIKCFHGYFVKRFRACYEKQWKSTPYPRTRSSLANSYVRYLLPPVFIFLGWNRCVDTV